MGCPRPSFALAFNWMLMLIITLIVTLVIVSAPVRSLQFNNHTYTLHMLHSPIRQDCPNARKINRDILFNGDTINFASAPKVSLMKRVRWVFVRITVAVLQKSSCIAVICIHGAKDLFWNVHSKINSRISFRELIAE